MRMHERMEEFGVEGDCGRVGGCGVGAWDVDEEFEDTIVVGTGVDEDDALPDFVCAVDVPCRAVPCP